MAIVKQYTLLSKIVDSYSGITSLPKNYKIDGCYRFLDYKNVYKKDDITDYSTKKLPLIKIYEKDIHKYQSCKNTIVSTWSSETNYDIFQSVYIKTDSPLLINGFSKKLIIKDKNFNPKWLSFYLNYSNEVNQLRKTLIYTTRCNMTKSILNLIKVPLIKIEAQRKIISIIEPFEKLKEQILLKKDKLIKIFIGLYNEFKGQSLTNLNSFIKISNKKYNNQSFYVDTGNIGYCNFVDYEKIEIKKSRADLSAISNSILFSKLNGINKILPIYNPFFNNFVYSTGFYNVTSNNNAYLLGFLLSNEFLNQKNNLAQGTTMKGINNSVLTKIKMNVIDLRYESFHFDFAITLLSNYIVVAYKLDLIIRNLAKFLIK